MTRLPPGDEGTSVLELRMGSKPLIREIAETLLIMLVIFTLVRSVVQNFLVEGESMLPTLNDGEYVLLDHLSYFRWDDNLLPRLLGQDLPSQEHYLFGSGPQRGDIVIFRAWHEDKDYIKRVIGLPGETVEIRAYDHVYINGMRLNEPYIHDTANYSYPPTVVPANTLFVLGDNRRNSSDSHLPDNGPVPMDRVVGRAWFAYWPPGSFGVLPHPTYDSKAGP